MLTPAFPFDFVCDNTQSEHCSAIFEPHKIHSRVPSKKWKTLIPLLDQISFQHCVQVLLWNIASKRFVYEVDKRNVIGYRSSLYLAEDGISFFLSNMHPLFLTPNLVMQKAGFEYMLSGSITDINKIFLNVDFLYKNATGAYIHVLQQIGCIETDNDGRPLLLLCYIYDITYVKKENTANLIIATPNNIQLYNYDFNSKSLQNVQPLSKQEKTILSYLANGKSSKEIAQALFISPLTIDTHRRHLLHKTNCLNTSSMISYAKLVGML